MPAKGAAPSNHLYRNNHDGTFTDVTAKAGLAPPAGDKAFALGTTTTTGGKISTLPITARTACITTKPAFSLR